jgi:hypothetical protein
VTVFVNPESGSTPKEKFRSRDYTGVTLGYWAGGPDRALTDWIFRSTTLETLQTPAVQIGTGIGVSAWPWPHVPSPAADAGPVCRVSGDRDRRRIYVIDDQPHDASSMEHDDHRPRPPHRHETAAAGRFDVHDKRGKFMEKAGPGGNPDLLEEMVIALYDLLGWHVRHDLSNGPAAYQITAGGDGHPDSVLRSASQWETATGAHIDYTPVDNLAMSGWTTFTAAVKPDAVTLAAVQGAPGLGWSLHALGDATVPMHVVGTTGFGHRPYEEAFDNRWEQLVIADLGKPGATVMSARQAREIVNRALVWREFILQWRANNGGTTDVPVRRSRDAPGLADAR